MFDDILTAIPFGIILAFTIGPVFFVLLETSATKGFKSALIFDCGVILADILFILIAFITFTSCEEVIELDLKDTEPRVIIEAKGDIKTRTCNVNITLSNGFYDVGDLETLSDATVVLSDEGGASYLLEESTAGQ